MPYGYITAGQALTELLERLGDPSATFWTNNATFSQSEVAGYLVEAIRTWNAFAWYFRNRESFTLDSGVPFYDVTTAPSLEPAGGVRPYTVTDQNLIGMIEYHLLEPYSLTSWAGSEMFSFDAVTQAIQRRLNQFLVETGIILTEAQGYANASGQVTLPDGTMDIVRACWIDAISGLATPVWASDSWAGLAYKANWNVTTGTPKVFEVISTPQLTLQLIPPPQNPGYLDYLAVVAGPTLNPSAGATVLGILDDFSWVIKFGAMADLLGQDGPARDPERSQYCEQRWEQGCELARTFASAIQGQINGVVCNICAVFDLDTQAPGWQSNVGYNSSGAQFAYTVSPANFSPVEGGPIPVTVTLPNPTAAGNTILVMVSIDTFPALAAGVATVTDSLGNTYQAATAASPSYYSTCQPFFATSSGGPVTVTVNVSASPSSENIMCYLVHVAEYAGFVGLDAFAETGDNDNSGTLTANLTTSTRDVLLMVGVVVGGSPSSTPEAPGYTVREQVTSGGVVYSVLESSAIPGAQSVSLGWSFSRVLNAHAALWLWGFTLNTVPGAQNPSILASAGTNLIAPYPEFWGAGSPTATLDMVANATVPASTADFIQVGREELDVILDYAVHLAAFKMQGTEFEDTVPHYQRMVRLASQYNERLDASTFYLEPIAKQSVRQVIRRPRRISDEDL